MTGMRVWFVRSPAVCTEEGSSTALHSILSSSVSWSYSFVPNDSPFRILSQACVRKGTKTKPAQTMPSIASIAVGLSGSEGADESSV